MALLLSKVLDKYTKLLLSKEERYSSEHCPVSADQTIGIKEKSATVSLKVSL